MADRPTGMTPVREERRLGRGRASEWWGGSPGRTFQRLADEMERLFDDVGLGRRGLAPWPERDTPGAWAPDIDVFQKNNELTIRADLPGMRREDVTVDVTDDAVTIQGERKQEHEEEREGVYRTERSYGSFCRVIQLPDGAITDQAKASFRDGVLEITMPAPPASRGRRIEIADTAKK